MHPNRLSTFPHNHTPTFSLKQKSRSRTSDTETSVSNSCTPILSDSLEPSFDLPNADLDARVNSALNFLRRIGRQQTPPPTKKLKFTDYDVYYRGKLRENYIKLQAVDCGKEKDDRKHKALSIETDRQMDLEQSQDKDLPWTPTRDRNRSEGLSATQGNTSDTYNKAPYCRLPTTPEIANQLKEKKFLFNTVDEFNPQRQNLLDFNSKKSFQTAQNESLNQIFDTEGFQSMGKIPESKNFSTIAGTASFGSPNITPFSPPIFNPSKESKGQSDNDMSLSVFKTNTDNAFGGMKGKAGTSFFDNKSTSDNILSATKLNADNIFSAPKVSNESPLLSIKKSADSMFSATKPSTESHFLSTKSSTESPFLSTKSLTESPFLSTKPLTESSFLSTKSSTESPFSATKPNNISQPSQQPSIGAFAPKVSQTQSPSISAQPKLQASSFFADNPIEVPIDDEGFDDQGSGGEADSASSSPKASSKTPTFGASGAKQNLFNFQDKPLPTSNIASTNTKTSSLFGNTQKESATSEKPKSLFEPSSNLFGNKDSNTTSSLFGQPPQTTLFSPPKPSEESLFPQPLSSSLFSPPKPSEGSLFPQPLSSSLFSPPKPTEGSSLPQPSLFSSQKSSENSLFGQAPQPSLFGQSSQGSLFNSSLQPTPSSQPTSSLFSSPQPPIFSQLPSSFLSSSSSGSFSLGLPGGNLFKPPSSAPQFGSSSSINKPTYENMLPSQTAAKSLFTPPSISFSLPSSQAPKAPVVSQASSAVSSFFMAVPQEIPMEEGFAEDAFEEGENENSGKES